MGDRHHQVRLVGREVVPHVPAEQTAVPAVRRIINAVKQGCPAAIDENIGVHGHIRPCLVDPHGGNKEFAVQVEDRVIQD